MNLSAENFDRAALFVNTHARPIDRCLFACNYSGQTLKVLFARDAPGKRGAICKCVPEFIEKNL
jgi:hypothetical protein